VIIINQTMAKRFWPNETPIGKFVRMDYVPDEPLREVVGVVGDIRMNRQQRQIGPTVYVPYLQQTPRWMGAGYSTRAGMYFILRAGGNPLSRGVSTFWTGRRRRRGSDARRQYRWQALALNCA